MLDFLMISEKKTKSKESKEETLTIFPKFVITGKSKDLMIRGGDFYAIWIEAKGLWSTEEDDALRLIDEELKSYKRDRDKTYNGSINISYMWDADSGMIDKWHKYCQRQMRDNFHPLDENLVFANTKTTKDDYATKRLSYALEPCDIPNYEKLISTLYEPSERRKLEWAIGAIITGDSKIIQKFEVLYGAMGTGKSTILNIIQMLFDGYYTVFDAKALGSSNNSFALEAFKSNPLIAIQHDGDLSKIEDNTKLNSLVSHEKMVVNEKFKSIYETNFKCFLFMGTNKPVKITDAKSGLIRRLIDVSPSGNKLSSRDYKTCMKNIPFELGGIACHCRDVYLDDPGLYDDYIPLTMLGASNDFYNFVLDSYYTFKNENKTTLKIAWEMYKEYCDTAKVQYPYSQRLFKEELKNYFKEFEEEFNDNNGKIYAIYTEFRTEKFQVKKQEKSKQKEVNTWLELKPQTSIFDEFAKDYPAQYANKYETPRKKWEEITTKLSDLNTKELHYVKLPINHIIIDFDICDKNGNKDFEANLKEANKWPKTYAEVSKSGKGIHLHYIYTGDPTKLSRVYDDKIEVKVYVGDSALRRKLTLCNDIPVAKISSGLPLKGDDKVVSWEGIQNEKMLRTMIKKNLRKEYHAATKPSVDYIYDLLEDAYNRGIPYDVSDMRGAIAAFAASSSHQADYCLKLVGKMKFKSESEEEQIDADKDLLIFFDCEVFPNLFLVNWKTAGEDQKIVRMINPKPSEIEELLRFKLIGFNNRRYDNHMLYARMLGYSEKEIYELSQKIIASPKGEGQKYMFREAYNLSYTDVYDFCSKKQSLKKWEIELGIHHKELGLPWDQPVPKERWEEVAKYCDNDVIATEAVWNARQADFVAREIQVELVKALHGITNVSVNNTTNELSTLIIFGKNRNPQDQFNYRDLSKPVGSNQYREYQEKFGHDYEFHIFKPDGVPTFKVYHGEDLPNGYSILPFFPGYKFEKGVSTYLGEEIGEGGKVYSEPGMYVNVWDGDCLSMHPTTMETEVLFGPKYTKAFSEVKKARVAIKHKDFDTAANLLGGALAPFLNESQAKDLAQALKIVINSIYGLTSASFINAFRDPRNIDNIVAKRGALFMTLLKSEVQKLGYQVCHIKTDSIKIPNATESIREFVVKFGREFGYEFETEAEYSKYCLVNDAVYIAKDKDSKWTAVGKQFQIPYVYKTLFSNEPIVFEDMCETKAVTSALYLDMNEGYPDVTALEAQREKTFKKDPNFDPTEIDNEIAKGHNYIFVGRVGSFCPVLPGAGGGWLCREADDNKTGKKKYVSATGAKGYRWMESEMIRELGKEDFIDISYYRKLVDKAVETISQYGDFEWFTSDDEVHEPELVSTDFDVR